MTSPPAGEHAPADGDDNPHVTGRSISNAVGVQLVARALGTVASIATVAITTRHLGVKDFGILTTAVVFVGLWIGVTELGVGAVIVRRVSAGRGQLADLVGVNLGLSLVYCVPVALAAAGSGLLVYRSDGRVHPVLLAVCVGLLLTTIANCFQPVYMAKVRFTGVAAADLLARLGSLVATVVVVHVDGGLVWFGVVQIVPPAVQLLVLGIGAYRLGPLRPRFDRAASWSLLRESLPQTGVLIVATLYWRADAVILTVLGKVREVGAYGLAYTIAFTLSVLSTFFLASTLSTMSSRFANDRPGFVRFVGTGVEAMLFLGLPIAVFGAVLAHPLVSLLASGAFAGPAAVPLALLLSAVALTFLTGLLSQALFAAHDQRFLLKLSLVNVLFNIALNLVLVPPYGAVGSAAALLVSEVSGVAVAIWRLARVCGFRMPWGFIAHLAIPLAAGGGVAAVVRHLPVLTSIALVGVVYVVVNLVIGPVRLGTVRALRATTGAQT